MLSDDDNRLMTAVGAGTPMGRLLREYWVPVLRSERLVAGGAPHAFEMFGERYVAYRSPDGRVGIVDEACPHRGASLALARNEDCGLRCIYHGWTFDHAGTLVEAPTHPASVKLERVRSIAHPARERNGMVWGWFGAGEPPALPVFAFSELPEGHVATATALVHANWVQLLEGLWDVFHAQILHNRANRTLLQDMPRAAHYFSGRGATAGGLEFDAPEMRAQRTDYGFVYQNVDAAKETHFAFIMPWYVHHTVSPLATDDKAMQIHVPIDDDHTLLWQVFYNRHAPLKPDGYGQRILATFPDRNDFLRNLDRSRAWGQDRELMQGGESFTGIGAGWGPLSIYAEDVAMAESQGRLSRANEYLGPTDAAVVTGRRTLLDAVRAHQRGEGAFALRGQFADVEAVFVAKDRSTASHAS